MQPIRLAANPVSRFYRGGAAIAELRGGTAAGELAPEDWVGSATATFGSAGEGLTRLEDGRTLRAAIEVDPDGFLGPRHAAAYGANPALLVKLLDAGERLPVHCHPSREFARRHLDCPYGKTEAWVITATRGAAPVVHLGFRQDADLTGLAGWVAEQRVGPLLASLNTVPVAPGDTVLVPAGTPHAIGEGVLLVELQEPTDFSVLLEWDGFAVDGRRDGHLGLGFDLALRSLDRAGLGATDLARLRGGRGLVRPGVEWLLPAEADQFFRAERLRPDPSAPLEAAFSILVVTAGTGRLETSAGALDLARGDTVLVPFAAGPGEVTGRLEAVRCLPPAPEAAPDGAGPPAGEAEASRRGPAVSGGELLVGIDVGTTACKAAVVRAVDGVEVAHGTAPTPWTQVPTGAELAPADLLDAAVAACAHALQRAPDGPVVGAGVTSMAETGVLLDRHGQPLAPAIAWHDARGAEQAAALGADLGAERFSAHTGLPVRPLFSIAKYAWLRANHPEVAAASRWLGVAEWVLHRLGGEQVAEYSLASRTGFLEVARRAWWDEARAWASVPAGLLPELIQAGSPAGTADGGRLPRLAGAALTVAGHDHLSASVGAGATRPGDLFDSCGTAEALIRAVPPPVAAADVRRLVAAQVTVGWHVLPGQQALLGASRAGLALDRFLDLLGVSGEQRVELDQAAAAVPPGSGGLAVRDVFGKRAALEGIGADATPAAVWRAAIEAVAERAAELRGHIEAVAGPSRRLVLAGGWARSPAVRSVKLARLGRFDHPAVTEAGARGAALLAGVAAGRFAGIPDLPAPAGAAPGPPPRPLVATPDSTRERSPQ